MSENQIQTGEPKICQHCGTENEWRIGQCISCRRTSFITRRKQAANKKSSLIDILASLLLIGISFYFLHLFKGRYQIETWAFPMTILFFFISIGSLVNSIYKYRNAKNILIWNIIIFAIYIILISWQYLGNFIR